MPQLIPVALAAVTTTALSVAAPATIGAVLVGSITVGQVVLSASMLAFSMITSTLMGSDRPSTDQQAQDRKHMVRGTSEARQVIYGTCRVTGALVYAGSSGTNKEYLHLVLAVATHRCNSIGIIWLNGMAILPSQLDASGNLTDRQHPMHGRVRIQRFLGDQTSAPGDLIAESPDGHTAAHALRDCTYLYIRLQYDPERMSNMPNVECLVEGRTDIWDPRSNTTGFSNNWALCVLNYIRWDYGLRCPLDLIDTASFIAAANLADEMVQISAGGEQQIRYLCDGAFKLDRNPVDVLEQMLDAGAGMLCRVGGRFRLYGGAYRAPTGAITASDLCGKTEIVPRPARSELFNGVKASFIDPARDWGAHPASPVLDPAMAVEDGGFTLWREIDLPFVTNRTRAERLARIALLDHRDGLTIRTTVKFSSIRFCVGQVITFTDPRVGMVDKVMMVRRWDFDPSGMGIQLLLREHAPFTYGWTFDQAYNGAPAPNTTLVNAAAVDAPQGISFVEEIYVAQNGAGVRTRIVLRWVPPAYPFVSSYEVQTRPVGATEWRAVAPTAGEPRADIDDMADGLHTARVRARSMMAVSEWVEIQFRAGMLLAQPPADVTGLALQCVGGMAWLRWDRHHDLDVRVGGRIEIRHTPFLSPSWASSTSIGEAMPGDASFTALPLKPGWYLAKAVDAGGRYSASAAVAQTVQATALTWAPLAMVEEQPAFIGAGSAVIVVDNKLRLDAAGLFDDLPSVDAVPSIDWMGGITGAGLYNFANGIDLGVVRRVRLTTLLEAVVITSPGNEIDSRTASIDDWFDVDGIAGGETDAWIEVRDTSDNPASSPAWSSWRRLDAAEFVARGFEFRTRLRTADPAHNLEISTMRVTCEETA